MTLEQVICNFMKQFIITCPICEVKHTHDFPSLLMSDSLTVYFCNKCKELETENRIKTALEKEQNIFISKEIYDLLIKE
jgi:hypothetical protein